MTSPPVTATALTQGGNAVGTAAPIPSPPLALLGARQLVARVAGARPQAVVAARPSPRMLSFVLVVLLPVALAAAYFLGVASDQFVTEFRFTLSTVEPPRYDPLTLLSGAAGRTPATLESQILVQYIGSRAVIDQIDRSLDLRQFFATADADWWARLPRGASIEALVHYWKGQVDPFFDPATGTVTVRVRAFSAPEALRLAQAVVGASEKLVNDLSSRVRGDAVCHAEAELSGSEKRLKTVLGQMREFRDREGMIDPLKAAQTTELLAARTRDELLRDNAELATLKSYMRDDAPSVKVLKARIRSLEAQQHSLSRELTDKDRSRTDTLSRVLGSYEELESERKFAEAAYQHALQALDQARANADRQQVFIASFVPPSLPEQALYPRRWRSVATVALMAFALWAIGGLIIQSVRDHVS